MGDQDGICIPTKALNGNLCSPYVFLLSFTTCTFV